MTNDNTYTPENCYFTITCVTREDVACYFKSRGEYDLANKAKDLTDGEMARIAEQMGEIINEHYYDVPLDYFAREILVTKT